MRVANRTKEISEYTTWYDFRKDLGKRLGYMPLNWRWLEVKPQAPLPWNDSHMQSVLSVVARLEKQKATRKRSRSERLSNGVK